MQSIVRASVKDIPLLSEIATTSFIQSHGHSAGTKDIENYVTEKYSIPAFEDELSKDGNIYHIIFYDEEAAGYSKILLNTPFDESFAKNIAKLDRIYLLEKFYDLKLGAVLFQYNLQIAKKHEQTGIWLYTWKENQRAIRFYMKSGFEIIGSHDFSISATHSNPNHLMYLQF